jgi:peptidoglycan-associated lipoprotein
MTLTPRSLWTLALTGAAAATLSACAHHEPPPPAPTAASTPAPMAEAPPPSTAPYQPAQSQSAAPIPGSAKEFVVSAGDRIYFGTNESTVSSEGGSILDAQAQWLQRYPQVMVRIEGNCDERGTREYNLALGARRAEAVKDYLAAHGIAASRITTISYGKEKPIDPGTGEEAWAHNRNAHTTITAGAVGGGTNEGA